MHCFVAFCVNLWTCTWWMDVSFRFKSQQSVYDCAKNLVIYFIFFYLFKHFTNKCLQLKTFDKCVTSSTLYVHVQSLVSIIQKQIFRLRSQKLLCAQGISKKRILNGLLCGKRWDLAVFLLFLSGARSQLQGDYTSQEATQIRHRWRIHSSWWIRRWKHVS